MTYQVAADIKYLDGSLAGLEIPAGYRVSYPNKQTAMRSVRFVAKTFEANDFVRATGTGNRYVFTSRPTLHYFPTLKVAA